MITESKKEVQEEVNNLRFIELSSDTTFKYLYKNEKTRKWLNYIIKEKFNIDLSEYKLIDNELNTGNIIKDYRLDLILENKNNIVIIEMNKDYYDFLDNKNYQYLFRVAGSRFETGEKYTDKLTKLILFNGYKNKKLPSLKTANFVFEEKEVKLKINDIESFEIYLPNYKDMCYDNNEVDVSLSLFSCDSYDDMRKLTKNPKDIMVIEELERLAMNEEFIFEYDREAVQRKTENSIRSEGLIEGITTGEKNKQIEIAKSMLEEKILIETISKCTGLTIEEINNLK